MTKHTLLTPLTIITISALIAGLLPSWAASALGPPVLITELQTGYTDSQGIESPRYEFVEIANVSSGPVDMTGWKLEYLSAANNGSTPGLTIDTISGQIGINGHGIWEHEGYYPVLPDSIFGFGDSSATGYFAKSGGHVRLMNGANMIDCVAWGSAVTISGCDKVSTAPGAGYTIQRQVTGSTYDKSAGVKNLTPATPKGGNIYSLNATPPVSPPPVPSPDLMPQKECENVELSEILANPAGDDAQAEFIELYNPTSHVQILYGCILKLSNGKQYEFPVGASLNAYEYKAYMYQTTGLQLSNTGATVTLVSINGESSTTYPTANEDQAWAWVDDSWVNTRQPTPNSSNILSQTLEDAVTIFVSAIEPCPTGKYRSPETNRCRSIAETASSLTSCNAEQERNPATGRCRKKTVTSSNTTCPVGQEKNLATNRCRKIDTAGGAKACDPGQERNPETGRCRKLVTKTAGKVLAETTSKKTYHYVVIASFLVVIMGYGVYEYRHDITNTVRKLKERVTR